MMLSGSTKPKDKHGRSPASAGAPTNEDVTHGRAKEKVREPDDHQGPGAALGAVRAMPGAEERPTRPTATGMTSQVLMLLKVRA